MYRPKTEFTADGNGLLDALTDAAERVEDDPTAITEHSCFDPAYGALVHFGRTGPAERARAAEVVLAGLAGAVKGCKRALSAFPSDAELAEVRETLKKTAFLASRLVQEAEKATASGQAGAASTARGRGKQPPKKSAKVAKGVAELDWAEVREAVVVQLLESAELDLCALWGHRAPDEALVHLYTAAATAVLEQPAALKGSSAALREALWRLLSLAAVRYGGEVGFVGAVVSLVLGYEHLPHHLAELMRHLLDEHQAARLVAALVQEVTALSPQDMGVDSAAPKNVAAFLVALAARAPLMLLANAELLLDVLASDAYTLRCGAVSAFGQLQIAVAAMPTPLPPEVADAASGLIASVVERLHDTSSFVRVRALATLSHLCESRALPTDRFGPVARLGLARLADKNANVRRAALQLYARLLEFNPFCATLRREALVERREALCAQMPAGWRMPSDEPPAEPAEPAAKEGEEVPDEAKATGEAAEGEAATTEEATGEEAATKETPPDTEPASDEPSVPLPPEVAERQMALMLLDQALGLHEQLSSRLGDVTNCLGSQTNSDVLEALRAVVAAHAFELDGAAPAEMLTLVWSREPTVKAAVLDAAQEVWLRPTSVHGGSSAKAAAAHTVSVALGLLELVSSANAAQLASLEEVVKEWQAQQLLPSSLHALLWEAVKGEAPELAAGAPPSAALALLNMASVADASVLRCKLHVVLSLLRGPRAPHPALAREACVAMLRCATAGGATVVEATAVSFLRSIDELLPRPPADADAWFSFAEAAINAAFALHAAPEEWCGALLRQLAAAAFPDGAEAAEAIEGLVCSGALGRLFFAVGHACIKMLEHIEACEKALARRRNELVEQEAPPAAAKKKKGGQKGAADAGDDHLAAELGVDAAAAEANSDALMALGEALVRPDGLIGAWAPLVCHVCSCLELPAPTRSAAVLTLCKLMATSGAFCEEQLPLLFTLMGREPEQAVRATIAVALGDLVVRHPNRLEPWTDRLYSQLRDSDVRVRKNMLMVLTHLILNDMVKVKGRVSEMARCLLDEDPRVAAHARLFFSEFAKKGSSPVYNLLPDIMSSLSSDESLGSAPFREVMGFLIGFIQKDRQCEAMVEKLCARFAASDAVAYHRNVAFCVGALQHTERSVRKLAELSKLYAGTLTDDEVHAAFVAIVAKARKGARAEFRTALDEFEAELARARGEAVDEAGEAAPPAADGAGEGGGEAGAGEAAAGRPRKEARGKEARGKKAPSRQRRSRKVEDEDEDEDEEDEGDGEAEAVVRVAEVVAAACAGLEAAHPTSLEEDERLLEQQQQQQVSLGQATEAATPDAAATLLSLRASRKRLLRDLRGSMLQLAAGPSGAPARMRALQRPPPLYPHLEALPPGALEAWASRAASRASD